MHAHPSGSPLWKLWPLAVAAAAVLLAAPPTYAGPLEGFVRSSADGEAVGDALVTLWRASGDSTAARPIATAGRSSAVGFYQIRNIAPGTYRRTCRAAGYREFADSVVIGEGTLRRDVVLQPDPFLMRPVDVSGERQTRDLRGTPSYVELPARELKRLPGGIS